MVVQVVPTVLTIKSEKGALTEEGNRIITTIRQMQASLEDSPSNGTYKLEDDELKITLPLLRCLESLKAKHNALAKVHRERYEQVKSTLSAQVRLTIAHLLQS